MGGCCGTDDTFIAKYVPLVEGKTPRKPVAKPDTMWLSGLELLDVTPEVRFVNVGERCNVAGSRLVHGSSQLHRRGSSEDEL